MNNYVPYHTGKDWRDLNHGQRRILLRFSEAILSLILPDLPRPSDFFVLMSLIQDLSSTPGS